MSDELVLWSVRQQCGSLAARAVLGVLCDISRHDTGPVAWPSIETLADRAEVDPRTARAALKLLVERRLIVDSGQRRGRTGQVVVWSIGPARLTEMGALGDHAVDSKTDKSVRLEPAKTDTFVGKDPQKCTPTLTQDSKKEAQAGVGARNPVDNGDTRTAGGKAEGLGEGFAGLHPSSPGADPPPVLVDAGFEEWGTMERSYALPGPIRRTVAREAAMIRMLRARGSVAVAAVIAAAGFDHGRPLKPHQRRFGQGDWLTMFDQVFEADPEYRDGMRLFDALLALPATLLPATGPPDIVPDDPLSTPELEIL